MFVELLYVHYHICIKDLLIKMLNCKLRCYCTDGLKDRIQVTSQILQTSIKASNEYLSIKPTDVTN